MKKTAFLTLLCMIVLSFTAFAQSSVILINSEQAVIGEGMGSIVEKNSRTFVPVRFVLEYFGYEVFWDGEKETVLGRNNQGRVFIMQVGSPLLIFVDDDGTNQKSYLMDVEPFLNYEEGRTYVPLRFLAEGLGYKVGYDEATRTVTLDK